MAVAKAYGAKKIIAFDIEQSRVDFAVKYNADIGVVCPFNTEKVEHLKFATDFMNSIIEKHGLGLGVDLTIEATGAEACVQMAVVLTKSGGTCKLYSVKVRRIHCLIITVIQAGLGKQLTSVPLFLFTAKELTMKGTHLKPLFSGVDANLKGTVRYTPGCFADAIDLLDRKAVNLAPLITSTYPLTKANDAFKAQAARKDIKIVIVNQE
jgi:D-xylulose reductase